jgi:hypothetical protein
VAWRPAPALSGASENAQLICQPCDLGARHIHCCALPRHRRTGIVSRGGRRLCGTAELVDMDAQAPDNRARWDGDLGNIDSNISRGDLFVPPSVAPAAF